MKGWGLLLGIVIVVLFGLAVGLLLPLLERTGVVVPVRDALSGAPVWDASIRVGRWDSLVYSKPASSFLSILPGRRTLVAEAPGYLPASERVVVTLGKVTDAPPVALTGYRIPGLRGFALSADREKGGLSIRLAPLDSGGRPIREFPCVDIRAVVRVFIQVDRGAVATEPRRPAPGREPFERGAGLFDDVVSWTWNAEDGNPYRYRLFVPNERIASLPAPYVVVEALVLVPDLRRIGEGEVEAVARKLAANDSRSAVREIEQRYGGRLRLYDTVAWNVPNA